MGHLSRARKEVNMNTPHLYAQCVDVYDAMYEHAVDGTYRGYLTYLFEDLGLGISRYTPIMRRLVAMGCIRQIVAGGRGVPSEWELVKAPDMETYLQTAGRRQRSRIQDLERRLHAVEEHLGIEEAS
jgi:hypothetical protein